MPDNSPGNPRNAIDAMHAFEKAKRGIVVYTLNEGPKTLVNSTTFPEGAKTRFSERSLNKPQDSGTGSGTPGRGFGLLELFQCRGE